MPRNYIWEWRSWSSEQQYGKTKGNVAFWRVCCSKPYEWVQMAILPDWRQLMIVPTSSRGERRELRSAAITHLERADDLKRAVIELLLQMEETLGSQAPFEKVSD